MRRSTFGRGAVGRDDELEAVARQGLALGHVITFSTTSPRACRSGTTTETLGDAGGSRRCLPALQAATGDGTSIAPP